MPALAILWTCAARAPLAPPSPLFPLHEDWRIAADGPASSTAHASLAFDGDTVFIATPAGVVSALEVGSGVERWKLATTGTIAAADGLLIVKHPDGPVEALSARDGSPLWAARTGIAGDVPALVGGGRVVLAGRGMAVLDARSGEKLWSVRGLGHFTTAPVVVSNRVLAGTQEGALHCLDLGTGKLLWSYRTRGPLSAATVADTSGHVFLGGPSGRIVGLRLSSGRQLWRWIVGTDTAFPGTVVGDVVCFASYDAVLHALKRGNGHLAWRAPLPSRPLSAPILHGGTLFVACYGSRENLTTFVAVDAKTGKRLGVFDLAGELDAPPIFPGARFVVALRAGGILGLSLAPPSPQGASPKPTPDAAASPQGASPTPTPDAVVQTGPASAQP